MGTLFIQDNNHTFLPINVCMQTCPNWLFPLFRDVQIALFLLFTPVQIDCSDYSDPSKLYYCSHYSDPFKLLCSYYSDLSKLHCSHYSDPSKMHCSHYSVPSQLHCSHYSDHLNCIVPTIQTCPNFHVSSLIWSN